MVVALHSQDNVATALNDLPAGIVASVGGQDMTVLEPVPFGRKVALEGLSVGALAVKCGFPDWLGYGSGVAGRMGPSP